MATVIVSYEVFFPFYRLLVSWKKKYPQVGSYLVDKIK